MNKEKAIILAAALFCCLVLVSTAFAQVSANYHLTRGTQANAGGSMNSAGYVMRSTLGQSSAIGNAQSANYGLHAGYWGAPMHGVAPAHRLFLPVISKNAEP